jgi:hypothetical protein
MRIAFHAAIIDTFRDRFVKKKELDPITSHNSLDKTRFRKQALHYEAHRRHTVALHGTLSVQSQTIRLRLPPPGETQYKQRQNATRSAEKTQITQKTAVPKL